MNIHEIDQVFKYRRINLPHLDGITRSYNQAASDAIAAYFVGYGWSILELQNSDTKVAKILKPYLTHKRQHTDGGLELELENKKRHIDQSGLSASYNYLASSWDQLSGSNQFGQPPRNYNTPESNSRHLTNPTTTEIFTDPATTGNLDYTFNGPVNFLQDSSAVERLPPVGPAHITDNDDPRYTPPNKDLSSSLSIPGKPTNHTLTKIWNIKDYTSPLQQCERWGSGGLWRMRTLPYPEQQYPAYKLDGRRPIADLNLGAGIYKDHATTIPSSASPTAATPELTRIFQKLDNHSRDLATLLVFLGEADIPKSMFLRVAQPKAFFNREGRVVNAPAPDTNPLFKCSQNLDPALEYLESLILIRINEDARSISVLPKLRSLVESILGDATSDMEYKASMAVFQSFPEDRDTDCVNDVDG